MNPRAGLPGVGGSENRSRRQWAWEFLRRNPLFVEEWNSMAAAFPEAGSDCSLRLEPAWRVAMAKWGVIFRGRPSPWCVRSMPAMGSSCLWLGAASDGVSPACRT